jgi:hypothetical protein
MLCCERANQGRCQPGRRAVLEETKEPSDRRYSTLNVSFSQGGISLKKLFITFSFNNMTGWIDPGKGWR